MIITIIYNIKIEEIVRKLSFSKELFSKHENIRGIFLYISFVIVYEIFVSYENEIITICESWGDVSFWKCKKVTPQLLFDIFHNDIFRCIKSAVALFATSFSRKKKKKILRVQTAKLILPAFSNDNHFLTFF